MRKPLMLGILAVVAALSLVVLTGCNKASDSSDDSQMMDVTDTEAPASPTPTNTTIGTGSKTLTVINNTGLEIIGLALEKTGDAAGYPDDWTFSGFSLPDTATGTLSFTPEQGDGSEQNYDIKLTTSVDSLVFIGQVPLESLDEITFHFDEGVGYVTYVDPSTGQEVSTQEEAIARNESDDQSLPPDLLEEERAAGAAEGSSNS